MANGRRDDGTKRAVIPRQVVKNVCRAQLRPLLSRRNSKSSAMRGCESEGMRINRIACIGLTVVGLSTQFAVAGGEPLDVAQTTLNDKNTVIDDKNTVSDGKTSVTSTNEDLGVGNFSRFPVRISVSLRQGYDDNVFTTHNDRVESWFTNAGIALSYDFGSPRTQISLAAGAGVT